MTSTSNMMSFRLPVRARSRSRPRTASGNAPSSGTLTRSARVGKPSSRNSSPQHTQRRKPATMAKSRSLMDPLAALWTNPGDSEHTNGIREAQQQTSSKMMRPSSWHLMHNDYDSFATSPWEGEQPYLDAPLPPLFTPSTNAHYPYSSHYSNFQSRSTSHLPLENGTSQLFDYSFTEPSIAQDLFSMNQAMQSANMFHDSNNAFVDSGFNVGYPQSYNLVPQSFMAEPMPPFGIAGPLTGSSPIDPLLSGLQDTGSKEEGEELVGMGLYDDPRDTSAWDIQSDEYQSLLLGAVSGKGLKLEESFIPQDDQPSSDDEGSTYEEEDEDDDGADGDAPDDEAAYSQQPIYTSEPAGYPAASSTRVSPFEAELQQFDFTQQPQTYGGSSAGWLEDDGILTSFTADDLGAAAILDQASQGVVGPSYLYHAQ